MKRVIFKRKCDEILAKGNIVSLAWLAVFSIICIMATTLFAKLIFPENDITWQWVVSMFLDAGNFNDYGKHDITALIISLLGIVIFSTLLVGVCVNIFEGIAESVREGKRRYNLKGHILILGSSKYLKVIKKELEREKKEGRKVVVMSPEKQPFQDDFIYYKGSRFVEDDLKDACAANAYKIYILGGDNEADHDDKNLRCLKLLKKQCAAADHDIKCILLLREQTCVEVFQYLKLQGRDKYASSEQGGWTATGKHLLVDVLNEHECFAEMLLVNEKFPFLPIIKENDNFRSHVVIMGSCPMAQAIAYTVAQVSHYPNFVRTGKKTCITFIGDGGKDWMQELVSTRPGLFEISKYTYIAPDGSKTVHTPEGSQGDFLDIEWQFVDVSETSPLATKLLSDIASNDAEKLCICTCHEKSADALKYALHLPRIIYERGVNIAVYSNDKADSIVRLARKSNMYGNIRYFGDTDDLWEYSQSGRLNRGQRVNYIYSLAYDGAQKTDSPEDWWYIKSEADKSSSIYSANFITIRKMCFEGVSDKNLLYEAEHRRWMIAALLLGFFAAPENRLLPQKESNRQKKELFKHVDIIPYEALNNDDKGKDEVLVIAEDYILNGGIIPKNVENAIEKMKKY